MATTILLLLACPVVVIHSIVIPDPVVSPRVGDHYEPTWFSLDTRPIPDWYDDAKFGIFIHWGVFSVPALTSEWFWYNWKGGNPEAVNFMQKNYPPDYTYADFGKDFHASFYDPYEWASIFNASGAKYVVLTSKHHEGYTMWPSKYSFNWNSQEVGPARDLVGELEFAVRNSTDLRFGLYHSMFEWFHPLYVQDKQNGFHSRKFPDAKALPELYEIVNAYKPDVIWSDGEWEASSEYWNSTGFVAWLYNESPVRNSVVINDRWGNDTRCKHGGFLTCEDSFDPGTLLPQKWENCLTVDTHSWGYRRNLKLADVRPIEDLITALVRAVSCGGNLLLNIGPTSDGTIPTVFEERLRQIGEWLQVNGQSIFATKPWIYQNDSMDSDVWYTSKRLGHRVYAIVLRPPGINVTLVSAKLTKKTTVTLLGYPDPLKWAMDKKGQFVITLPPQQLLPDVVRWGFVLKMNKMANSREENPVQLTTNTRPEVISLWRQWAQKPKH